MIRLHYVGHGAKIGLRLQQEEERMFNIDKQEFGTFVAMLRKEKGITQKELAERLFISDKAVSKWETAASVPGIDLLVPLADQLGVTVTELLLCRRMEQDKALSATQVEQVVKTAISYSDKQPRTYQKNRKWGLIYILALLIACLELWFSYRAGSITIGLSVSMGLGAIFGIYFCFLAKEKLPAYYDENHISVYADGIFEMNLTGLSLNNNNWGKILKVGRIYSVTMMLAYPIISYIETLFFSGIFRDMIDLFVALFFTLGGLFIPLYIVGNKYKERG